MQHPLLSLLINVMSRLELQGVGNVAFRQNAKELCRPYKPHIICLLKTPSSNSSVDNLPTMLGFQNNFRVPSDVYAGGLWLMWKNYDFSLTIIHSSYQCIHAGIISRNQFYLISFPYIRSNSTNKNIWDFM